MDIAKRIKELMFERKWSKYKLAKECGVYITTVNAWLKGNYSPSLESVEDVCNAFGITLVEFFSGIEQNKLTPEQSSLLDKYQKVPENRRRLVINLIDILMEESRNQ